MEFLLDNPIATMEGPYFLLFYGFIIISSVLVLAIVKQQLDKTDKLPTPSIPPKVDPFEIAYLRGGINEMARAVVFSLLRKGFIEIRTDGKTSEIRSSNNQQNHANLSQIEQAAVGWFYTPRQPKDLFDSYGLAPQLEQYSQHYRAKLENQQILFDGATKNTFGPVKWTVLLIIFGLGAYKLLAAIANENFNIIFLVIFGLAGLALSWRIARLPRITKHGKAYLERLQTAFGNLTYESQNSLIPNSLPKNAPQTAFAGVDPLLLSVGVFGAGILAGTVYDNYNQAFQRAQASAGTGSCGSSCGSSCSSSSDGGGSSCGGGCGGCGGGGD